MKQRPGRHRKPCLRLPLRPLIRRHGRGFFLGRVFGAPVVKDEGVEEGRFVKRSRGNLPFQMGAESIVKIGASCFMTTSRTAATGLNGTTTRVERGSSRSDCTSSSSGKRLRVAAFRFL